MVWRLIWLLVVTCLGAACTTTPEVLELSHASAINAGLLTRELQRYSEDERRFADARMKNLQQLHNTVAEARERFEVDRLYTREAEGDDFEDTETELAEFIAKVDQVIEETRSNRVVVDAPEAVSVDERVKALAELTNSMALLAKPVERKDALIFLKGYIEAVREHVAVAIQSNEGAATESLQRKSIADLQRASNGRETNDGGKK